MNAPPDASKAEFQNKAEVVRDHGHPWDGRPGFDLLFIRTDTEDERDAMVRFAQGKFWSVWISGQTMEEDPTMRTPSAVLYKPSRIMKHWSDSPDAPHPGCRDGVELAPQSAHERARA